eukprot:evm.model.scf_45.5 EVM.evm.TU.scf_45.5   scf_45:97515-98967(-)
MSAFCPSCPPAAVRGIAGGGLRPRLPLRPARGAPRVAALSPGVAGKSSRTAIVRAGVDGGSDETVEEDATTAVSPRIPEKQEEEEEVPIWVKRERIRKMEAEQGMMEFPWPIYLSVSILMSIAVVSVAMAVGRQVDF